MKRSISLKDRSWAAIIAQNNILGLFQSYFQLNLFSIWFITDNCFCSITESFWCFFALPLTLFLANSFFPLFFLFIISTAILSVLWIMDTLVFRIIFLKISFLFIVFFQWVFYWNVFSLFALSTTAIDEADLFAAFLLSFFRFWYRFYFFSKHVLAVSPTNILQTNKDQPVGMRL